MGTLTLICAVLVGGAYLWLGLHRRNQAARIVPADTSAFVCISPTLLQLPRLRYADNLLESGAALAALPEVMTAAEDVQDCLPSDFDVDVREDVIPWLGREVSLAVVPQENTAPSLIVTAATRNRAASGAFLEKLQLEMEDQGVAFTENTYRGTQITKIMSPSGISFAYATFNHMVVVASDEKTLRASIDADEEGRASTLYGRRRFEDILSDLPANHLGYVYLAWPELVRPARNHLEEMGGVSLGERQVLQDVAFALSLRRDGLCLDYRAQFEQHRLSGAERDWLRQATSPRRAMDIAPADSLVYVSGQNLPLTLQFLEGVGLDMILNEIEYETGVDVADDVFDEMHGEYAWVVAPDRGGVWGDAATPLGLLLFIEVEDRRRVEDSLGDIFHALAAGGDAYLDQEQMSDAWVRVLEDDYGMTVTYGFVGDFLFFGSSREMARLAMSDEDLPLASDRLFQTTLAAMPGKLRGHSYIDVEGGLETIYRAMDDFEREKFDDEVKPYIKSVRAVSMSMRPMDDRGVLQGTLFLCTE